MKQQAHKKSQESPSCPACEGRQMVTRGTHLGGLTRWVTCGTCGGTGRKQVPVLKHQVTQAMDAMRPSCFEERPKLRDTTRVQIERLQANARCQDIKNELERLDHRVCALKEGVWTATVESAQKAIALRVGQLQTELNSLEQALALSDASLLKLLDTLRSERRAA